MPRTRSLAYSELKIGAVAVLAVVVASFLIFTITSPPPAADPVPQSTNIVVEKLPGSPGADPVDIELHYESEVNVGDDLLIEVRASSVDRGTLTLNVAGQGVTVSPNPAVLRLPGMTESVNAKLVLSTSTAGGRKVLISGSFSKLDPSRNASSPPPHSSEVTNIPPAVIAVEVIPGTTFGLTESQLKGVQVFSSIIVAVLTFVLGKLWNAKSTENKKA